MFRLHVSVYKLPLLRLPLYFFVVLICNGLTYCKYLKIACRSNIKQFEMSTLCDILIWTLFDCSSSCVFYILNWEGCVLLREG